MNEPICDFDNLRVGLSAIAAQRLFVSWDLGRVHAGKTKPPKIAFVQNGHLLRGSYASAELQESLMTLEEAISTAKRLGHRGVGIAFFPGCGVIGLDVDSCIINEQFFGTPAQHLAWNTFKFSSFTELSYSGKGVHAVALGNCGTIKANGELELFGDKNFLALTGFAGCGVASKVAVQDIDVVKTLIDSLGAKSKSHNRSNDLNDDLTSHLKSQIGQASIEDVRSALAFIEPNCDREMWLRIIWGIAHGLGDTQAARDLADQWSSGEIRNISVMNYAGTADVNAAFECFDPDRFGGVTVGTTFKIAQSQGWQGYEKRTTEATSSYSGGTFDVSSGDVSIPTSAPPNRTYVFADRVTQATLCTLGGSGGASKTMLMMQIAVAMACGKPIGDLQVAEGASLLFLGEEDDAERDRRFGGICEHMSADQQLVQKRIKCFAAAGVDIRLTLKLEGNPHQTALGDEIIELAKQHAANAGVPIQLIVIDHARLVLGGDPNAADDVTQLTRVLTNIAKQTGAAVVLIATVLNQYLGKRGTKLMQQILPVQVHSLTTHAQHSWLMGCVKRRQSSTIFLRLIDPVMFVLQPSKLTMQRLGAAIGSSALFCPTGRSLFLNQ
jgi:hypothetical protein